MNITVNTDPSLGMTGASAAGKLSGVSKTEKTAEASSNSAVIKAANFDRVDLSDTAIEYLKTDSESEGAESASDTQTNISSNDLVSESDDTVLASELYSYTETELQELMLDGTITRAEYEAELAKRSGEDIVVSD